MVVPEAGISAVLRQIFLLCGVLTGANKHNMSFLNMSGISVDGTSAFIERMQGSGTAAPLSAIRPNSEAYYVSPYRYDGATPLTALSASYDTSDVTIGRGAVRLPSGRVSDGVHLGGRFSGAGDAYSLESRDGSFARLPDADTKRTPADALMSGRGALYLPQLMSQTRLVNARIAQIRGDLASLVATVWQDNLHVEPHRSASTALEGNSQPTRYHLIGVTSPRTTTTHTDSTLPAETAPLVDSPLILTNAIDAVQKLVSAISNTRRVLAESIERPLKEYRSHLNSAGSLASQQCAPTATLVGFTSHQFASREEIAISFGLEECAVLRQQLALLMQQVQAVEERVLVALGVRDKPDYSEAHGEQCNGGMASKTKPPTYIVRRRQDVTVPTVVATVTATMRQDRRYRSLFAVKDMTSNGCPDMLHHGGTASITVGGQYAAAGRSAKLLTDSCSWSDRRIHKKTEYEYDLEYVEEQIEHEKEKQRAAVEGRRTPRRAATPQRSVAPDNHCAETPSELVPPASVQRGLLDEALEAPSDAIASEVPLLTEDLASPGPQLRSSSPLPTGDTFAPEISDALGGCDSDAQATGNAPRATSPPRPLTPVSSAASCTPTECPPVDAAVSQIGEAADDEQPLPLTHPVIGNDHTTSSAQAEHTLPSVSELPLVHFQQRLHDWIKSFLVSGACQWVSCIDEDTQKTFYFNLETGERQESLKDYFADCVAEAISIELLSEGEHDGVGWVLVPAGSTEYDAVRDYYCHQATGTVVWSLTDWIKEH